MNENCLAEKKPACELRVNIKGYRKWCSVINKLDQRPVQEGSAGKGKTKRLKCASDLIYAKEIGAIKYKRVHYGGGSIDVTSRVRSVLFCGHMGSKQSRGSSRGD